MGEFGVEDGRDWVRDRTTLESGPGQNSWYNTSSLETTCVDRESCVDHESCVDRESVTIRTGVKV